MSEIKTFSFDQAGVEAIRNYKYGTNWPVVYLIENGQELYIGETIRAHSRTKQHLENIKRRNLKRIHIISDDDSNKSATLDVESSLIEYFVGDNQFILQNSSKGLRNHDYFDRERYRGKFDVLWQRLQQLNLAKNDLLQIRNSDLFKYSPYKTLTDDQYLIATQILKRIDNNNKQTYLVQGGPGTGKTILATYLVKRLVEKGETEVGLVIAMTSLRKTLKNVFRNIPGLRSSMVIGPAEALRKNYKVLIVDEAHRLRRRRNIPNYGSFDKANNQLGLGKDGTELDWVLRSAEQVVLFFDEKQSVRPSDISATQVRETNPIMFELESQMRVKGGSEYLKFIDNLLEVNGKEKHVFSNYDFRIYEDIDKMREDIMEREREHGLSRVVAGYAWEWKSRWDKNTPDIVISDTKLFWNSQTSDWVNSPNAINEVGCIHTIQGYDLNYTGVIIGPEISFDSTRREVVIKREEYFDNNGHRGVNDPEELRRYIVNIYKTLLTRGILGTYVYIVDENLREYFKREIL